MKYYIDENENVYSLDDEVSIGFKEISEDEALNLIKIRQEKDKLINEAQQLLDSTQFKFGDDYDLKGTEEWLELKAKRQLARDFIRANKCL